MLCIFLSQFTPIHDNRINWWIMCTKIKYELHLKLSVQKVKSMGNPDFFNVKKGVGNNLIRPKFIVCSYALKWKFYSSSSYKKWFEVWSLKCFWTSRVTLESISIYNRSLRMTFWYKKSPIWSYDNVWFIFPKILVDTWNQKPILVNDTQMGLGISNFHAHI